MTPGSYEADMKEFEKIDALKKDLYCANVLIDGYRARVKELELNKSEPHKCLEMAAYVAKEHLHSNNIAAAIRCLESRLSESNAPGQPRSAGQHKERGMTCRNPLMNQKRGQT